MGLLTLVSFVSRHEDSMSSPRHPRLDVPVAVVGNRQGDTVPGLLGNSLDLQMKC